PSIVRTECALVGLVVATVTWVGTNAPAGPVNLVLCGLLLWQVYIYGSAWVVNRWSRDQSPSEKGGNLDAAVRGVLAVRAPLVSNHETQLTGTPGKFENQPDAVTVRLLATHSDQLAAEREVRRHCPPDSR